MDELTLDLAEAAAFIKRRRLFAWSLKTDINDAISQFNSTFGITIDFDQMMMLINQVNNPHMVVRKGDTLSVAPVTA